MDIGGDVVVFTYSSCTIHHAGGSKKQVRVYQFGRLSVILWLAVMQVLVGSQGIQEGKHEMHHIEHRVRRASYTKITNADIPGY